MIKVSAKNTQKIAFTAIWIGGSITVAIMLLIVCYVLIQGVPEIGWSFLTTDPEGGMEGEGGIKSIIVSTIYLIVLTMIILIPLGIGAAIYLAEYARDNRLTRTIRYGVDTLAGIPSVIFGLFGFVLFVTILSFNFSLLSGALTLVCLLLPTLIRTSEEAIKTVPFSNREASLAMGATKWQTIWRVILPAALPGIITGVILSVGRAIGETACLYLTMGGSANFQFSFWPLSGIPESLLSPGRSLSLHVFYLATETNAFEKAMATAAVLIITIIIINFFTNWISQRFHKRMTGGVKL